MTTKETVAALLDAGQMVTCSWPGSGDLKISLQRHMVDNAMVWWEMLDANDRRRRTFASVLRSIKRATKRIKQQRRASQKEGDELAADIALFLGHELIYADGERWLVKGPTGAEILAEDHS